MLRVLLKGKAMKHTLAAKAEDSRVSIETNYLDVGRGGPETFSVEGTDIIIYSVLSQSESPEGRRIGGQASMPSFGHVSFQH